MSDTPMTDAVIANDDGGLGYIANLARLARKLERENAQLKAELERARQDRNRIAKDVRNSLLAELRASEGVAKALADWRETIGNDETNEATNPRVPPAPLVFES